MPLLEQLCEFLERAGRPRVCVIGDVMLDTYVWGEVSRISPEGPIPVLRVQKRERRPGGAAGVAAMLSALGARVLCAGAIGDDEAGRRLKDQLAELGIDASGLVTCSDRPTTVKTRYMGFVQSAGRSLQQIVRVDEERCAPLSQRQAAAVLASVRACDAEFMIVQDMAKGLFTPELLKDIISLARDRGMPVLVDPERGEQYARYAGANFILPNRYEAQRATGIQLDCEEAYRRAALKLLRELGLDAAIIKLDREGIFFATSAGLEKHVPTEAREVADVTGAGDMVGAAIGFSLAAGADLPLAVHLANAAAGMEVARRGAATISRAELLEELTARADPAARKLKSRDELRRIVQQKRSQGQKIVFTNGCFDLLHLGHVELVRYARSQGDLLIVGVNTDRSARELKGAGRPINTQQVRTRMLAALSDVDYVVLFDEVSVLPLIREIRPDVLVKGGDYGKEGVVGREFVESYGGQVKLAPKVEGLSTTELIERIARNHEAANREHSAGDNQGSQ